MRSKAQIKVQSKKRSHHRTNGYVLKPWQRYVLDRVIYVVIALILGMLQGSVQTRKAVEPEIKKLKTDNLELDDALDFAINYWSRSENKTNNSSINE